MISFIQDAALLPILADGCDRQSSPAFDFRASLRRPGLRELLLFENAAPLLMSGGFSVRGCVSYDIHAWYCLIMVSFLRTLFGFGPVELAPGQGWTVNVVSGTDFQDALRALKGSYTRDRKLVATLVPEPGSNPGTRAVRVEVGGRHVGYLPKRLAKEYTLEKPSECTAKITERFDTERGNSAYLGVKLNLAWPPRPSI